MRKRRRRNPLGLSSAELLIVGSGVALVGVGAIVYFAGNKTTANTGNVNPTAPLPTVSTGNNGNPTAPLPANGGST